MRARAPSSAALRVAVIGPLGYPGNPGGLTRHVEEVYGRLAERGIDTTVYARKPYTQLPDDRYRGMRIVALPVPVGRGIETFSYGVLASLLAFVGRFDVVHYHGVAAGSLCFVQRLRPARKLVFTHHRSDWTDAKWNRPARALLRWAAWIALRVAHAMVAVSESLAADLRRMKARDVVVIPNGVTLPPVGAPELLESMGLAPKSYAVAVGRVVPEKALHHLVDAFRDLGDLTLAIVGEPRYSQDYAVQLERDAPTNVRFLGRRSGEELGALYANAAVFVTASTNEGLPLGVLEAMGFGLPIVASDIPPHQEVLDGSGFVFPLGDVDALRASVRRAFASPDAGKSGGDTIRRRGYTWDAVADATERVLREVMRA